MNSTTIYAGGQFGAVGDSARISIAALDAGTGQATAWNPNANGSVVGTLALSENTLYVCGDFTSIGGQPRNRIAALDATNGTAMSWEPGPNGPVIGLALSGNVVYTGGAFTSIGGQMRNRIGALDATTGAAMSWNPNANGQVLALVVSGNTVYAGGYFTSILGSYRPYFAAISDAFTSVGEGSKVVSSGHLRAAPNPFDTDVALHFALPEAGAAEVTVYDLAGRLIRRVHKGLLLAGQQHFRWDGRNDAGRKVGPGLYLVYVKASYLNLNAKVLRIN